MHIKIIYLFLILYICHKKLIKINTNIMKDQIKKDYIKELRGIKYYYSNITRLPNVLDCGFGQTIKF